MGAGLGSRGVRCSGAACSALHMSLYRSHTRVMREAGQGEAEGQSYSHHQSLSVTEIHGPTCLTTAACADGIDAERCGGDRALCNVLDRPPHGNRHFGHSVSVTATALDSRGSRVPTVRLTL